MKRPVALLELRPESANAPPSKLTQSLTLSKPEAVSLAEYETRMGNALEYSESTSASDTGASRSKITVASGSPGALSKAKDYAGRAKELTEEEGMKGFVKKADELLAEIEGLAAKGA